MSEAVVKGTLLLLVVFAATPLLRRVSASTRHLVWSTGLVCLLALPVLTTLPWRIEILPGAASPFLATAADPIGVVAATTGSAPELGMPVDLRAEADPAADAAAGAIDRGTLEAASPSLGVGGASRSPSWPSREALLQAVLGLWFVAAALLLARIGLGAVVVRRIGRRATPLTSPAWTKPLWEAADRLDLPDAPRLLLSNEVPLPFTYGILRPTIVLPTSAEEWDTDRRWAVLFHELGHIHRRDLLSHMVGRIACALYWFHPLVWLAARRARAECERACDDLVLTAGALPSTYADHLLQIVSRASWSSAPAVAIPMAQRREFEGRMLAILEPDVPRHAPGRMRSAATFASVAAVALFAAVLAPAPSGATVVADASDWVAEPAADSRSAAPDAGNPAPDRDGGNDAVRDAPDAGTGPAVATPGAATPGSGSVDALASAGRAGAPVAAADTDRVKRWRLSAVAPMVDETIGQAIGPVIDGAIATGLSVAESVLSGILADQDFGFHPAGPMPMPTPTPTPAPLAPMGQRPRRDQRSDKASRATAWSERRSGQADSVAIQALIGVLVDPVVSVRRGAAHSLGELGDPEAVAALIQVLGKDSDADVRRTAAWALGEIGDPAAVPALSAAVRQDASADVRRMSAWALGEIESTAAVDALIAAVRDSDAEVRSMAVWALAEIGDARALPGFAAALADRDADVRRKAAWGLGEAEVDRAPAALVRALEDADADVRRTAAWALGQIEDPSAVPGLTKAMRDADADVRRTALWALGEIGGEAAYEALLEAIKSDDPELRRRAAQALGRSRW